jgi:putative ABC transport system permease protein
MWVVDPGIKWVLEYRALPDQKLGRVRSVPGVEWAEPFFNGWGVTELRSGEFRKLQILGVPRATLAGQPAEMIEGRIENLWIPDAIILEQRTAATMQVGVGDELKINDRRAVIVGICKAKRGFESNGIAYTTFEQAIRFSPVGREAISYVLVKLKPGADPAAVKADIERLGDVLALTTSEFRARTIEYVVIATGIGINFAITIALGFVVGLLLSASIFYQFTLENLRYFAVLKAMGTGSRRVVGMILVQAMTVGVVGFGIGTGAAGAFALVNRRIEGDLATYFPWQLLVGSFVLTLATIALASLLSIRRVIRVSPGVVFSS